MNSNPTLTSGTYETNLLTEKRLVKEKTDEKGNIIVYSDPSELPCRPSDLKSVFMTNMGIHHLDGFEKYFNLEVAWFSKNHLTEFTGMDHCIRITKLYLQDNKLNTLVGSLKKMKFLKVLLLHNNEIRDLHNSIKHLSHLQFLNQLSLFGNPLSHEEGYRTTVITSIPSLQILDRQNILLEERNSPAVADKKAKSDKTIQHIANYNRKDILPAELRIIRKVREIEELRKQKEQEATLKEAELFTAEIQNRPSTPPFPESIDFLKSVTTKHQQKQASLDDTVSSCAKPPRDKEKMSYAYEVYMYQPTKSKGKYQVSQMNKEKLQKTLQKSKVVHTF